MPKRALAGALLVHDVTGSFWDLIVDVIAAIPTRSVETLLLLIFAITLLQKATAQENHQPAVQKQMPLSASSSSWDGEPYRSYPQGQPELSILKITLAPQTELEWHSHAMPSAAHIVAGELTLERNRDGKKQRFTARQAVSESRHVS
jgi:quercetin dioxygenase-like cupin family protein